LHSSIARLRDISILALVCMQAIGCGPKLTAETVTEAVLKSPPFDGALAVIVPQMLPAQCDKLPSTQEAHAWGVLVASGFMQTTPAKAADGSTACSLTLTDRGAQRKSFGRIVATGGNWRVPVGGIGTDLPAFERKESGGDSVTVSFTWQFFRFRGVEGLLVLDKLPQSNKSLRAEDVPPRGVASATFHRQGSSWELDGVKLVQ
jgi:hypothetical protein